MPAFWLRESRLDTEDPRRQLMRNRHGVYRRGTNSGLSCGTRTYLASANRDATRAAAHDYDVRARYAEAGADRASTTRYDRGPGAYHLHTFSLRLRSTFFAGGRAWRRFASLLSDLPEEPEMLSITRQTLLATEYAVLCQIVIHAVERGEFRPDLNMDAATQPLHALLAYHLLIAAGRSDAIAGGDFERVLDTPFVGLAKKRTAIHFPPSFPCSIPTYCITDASKLLVKFRRTTFLGKTDAGHS